MLPLQDRQRSRGLFLNETCPPPALHHTVKLRRVGGGVSSSCLIRALLLESPFAKPAAVVGAYKHSTTAGTP